MAYILWCVWLLELDDPVAHCLKTWLLSPWLCIVRTCVCGCNILYPCYGFSQPWEQVPIERNMKVKVVWDVPLQCG